MSYDAADTDLSVVIPTVKDHVRTLSSIPDGVPVLVERDGSLNEARNRGVWNADTQIVAVMDDDIEFPADLLFELAERVDCETLLGVADWNYGWTAGRVMVFYRDLWADVGGFDESLGSHTGDTKFAIDALRSGYNLERVPRELFHHEEHERDISTWDHAWRGLYLALRHPRHAARLFTGMVSAR